MMTLQADVRPAKTTRTDVPPTQSPAPPISPALAALIVKFEHCDQQLNAWYANVFNPAVEASNARIELYRAAVAAIPHVEEAGGTTLGGTPAAFTSAKSYSRIHAEHYIECDGREPNRGADWDETIAAARRFIVADDQRNEAIRALGGEPRCDPALNEQEDAACAPVTAAREAIHDFPARSLADLHAKLAWIEADNGMDGDELLPRVLADVRRIAGEA